jgi:hypothetical protein
MIPRWRKTLRRNITVGSGHQMVEMFLQVCLILFRLQVIMTDVELVKFPEGDLSAPTATTSSNAGFADNMQDDLYA